MQITRRLCLCGLVFAALIPAGRPVGPGDAAATPRQEPSWLPTSPRRWPSDESQSGRSWVSAGKRHSEGTFTSDFTRYLDKMKAKDFVHWLINAKRFSSTKRDLKEEPRGALIPAGFPPMVHH